jgi:replicative DNA helicase
MKLSAPIFRLKRQAKLLARESAVPLHSALNQVARNEGFRTWSHLAASAPDHRHASEMLAQLSPGDLMLLGARPGHGKTLLGLELAVATVRTGRPAFFFTLEDHAGVVFDRLQDIGADRKMVEDKLILDTSDDICAEHIINRVGDNAGEAIVIIDYLQLLDQRRRNPELDIQMRALKSFASATGSIIVALSQIDRAFESTAKSFPELADIRLPNPFDLTLFTKICLIHNGEAHLEELA